jgi:hypothetical protein
MSSSLQGILLLVLGCGLSYCGFILVSRRRAREYMADAASTNYNYGVLLAGRRRAALYGLLLLGAGVTCVVRGFALV